MLYSVSVKWASSKWNTYRCREFTRQAVRTWQCFCLCACPGSCPHWEPWTLLAAGGPCQFPLGSGSCLFPPPTINPALQCPGYVFFTPPHSRIVDGACWLCHWQSPACLCPQRGSHSGLVSWVPDTMFLQPWTENSFWFPLNRTRTFPPVQSSEPHTWCMTPLYYRRLFSEGIL